MKRPVLVYDGDCGFCRVWIERWRSATGDAVDYRPSQSAAADFPQVPAESFQDSVWLFEPDGRTSSGAEAVFRSLSRARGFGWLPAAYRVPGVAPVSEACYRFVAERRVPFSRATRLLWGRTPKPSSMAFTTRLLLAGLGLCYLVAFVSLAVQLRGLIGREGLLPAESLLEAAGAAFGSGRWWAFPTLAWFGASDAALLWLCFAGGLASLGLGAGLAAGPCALVCWAVYLSLCAVGGDFMSFQWDALLLEAGLIAVFLAPWDPRPRRKPSEPPAAAVWLMRLLLLKLMLQSGAVKLLSGDPAWRDLTALTYHYWSQPLPTPLAWWFDRLPLSLQKASCALMFFIELAVPWLILAPRRARALAGAVLAGFMVLVAATGNYGFFNLLTIVLCLSCADDRLLGRETEAPAPSRTRRRAAGAFAVFWGALSLSHTLGVLGVPPPAPARALAAAVYPLRSVNHYGLFAVMTRTRDEIAIEVSADGREWREWPFKWKPGDPRRAPPVAAPHMPRLDWLLWFAALGEAGQSPWFGNLLVRLLEGSPRVKALLGPDPLGGAKPAYVRAWRYETRFAPKGAADRAWWTRKRTGLYFPVVSLKR